MFKTLKIITALILVLALADWPYDYCTLLRVITCVTGVWGAIRYYDKGMEGVAIVFGGIALLFNPIFPIYLDRTTWNIIDLAAAGFIGYSLFLDKRSNSK